MPQTELSARFDIQRKIRGSTGVEIFLARSKLSGEKCLVAVFLLDDGGAAQNGFARDAESFLGLADSNWQRIDGSEIISSNGKPALAIALGEPDGVVLKDQPGATAGFNQEFCLFIGAATARAVVELENALPDCWCAIDPRELRLLSDGGFVIDRLPVLEQLYAEADVGDGLVAAAKILGEGLSALARGGGRKKQPTLRERGWKTLPAVIDKLISGDAETAHAAIEELSQMDGVGCSEVRPVAISPLPAELAAPAAELKRRFREAFNGRGSVVLVRGEPGGGKTRLLLSFLAEAEREERYFLPLVAVASRQELAPPYFPLLKMLRDFFGEGNLVARLGAWLPEHLEAVPDLARMIAGNEDYSAENSVLTKDSLSFLLARIFRMIARETPLLLVVDNLQLADRATLEVLEALAGQIAAEPLMLIGLARDEGSTGEAADGLSALAGSPCGCEIRLSESGDHVMENGFGLSMDDECLTLLKEASVLGEVFDCRWLREISSLRGASLLLALNRLEREYGTIYPFFRGYRFASRELYEAVVGRLKETEKKDLHHRLSRLLEKNKERGEADLTYELAYHYSESGQLEPALEYLVRAGRKAIGEYAVDEARGFAERGLKLAEAEGESPPDKPLRELLRILLEVQKLRGESGPRGETLARLKELALKVEDVELLHWLRLEKCRLLLDTGQLANAADIALSLLNDLQQNESAPGMLAEAHAQAAVVLGAQGEFEAARDNAEKALAIFAETGDRHSECGVLRTTATLSHRQGDFRGGLIWLEKALAISREIEDRLEEGKILSNIGSSLFYLGEYDKMREHLERASRIHKGLGFRMSEGIYWNNSGVIDQKTGHFEQALEKLDKALRVRREIGDSRGVAATLNSIGNVYCLLGRWEEAQRHFRDSLDLKEELGDEPGRGFSLYMLGHMNYHRGRPEEADSFLRRAEEIGEKYSHTYMLLGIYVYLAKVRLEESFSGFNPREALSLAERAIKLAEDSGNRPAEALAHVARAQALSRLGRDSEALEAVEKGVSLLDTASFSEIDPEEILLVQYRTLVRNGRGPAAKVVLERISQVVKKRLESLAAPVNRRAYLERHASVVEALKTHGMEPDPGPVPDDDPGIHKRLHLLEALVEINKKINSSLKLDAVLETLVEEAVELLGAQRGVLLLLSSPSQIEARVARGLELEDWQKPVFSESRQAVEKVVRQLKPVSTAITELREGGGTRTVNLLCVPLILKGEPAGVLYLDSEGIRSPFRPYHLEYLVNFADQAAIAIDNASRFEQILKESEPGGRMFRFGEMISRHGGMRDVLTLGRRAAQTPTTTILITGESGVGKEVLARAIHFEGVRRDGYFVPVNCAAIPETLLESELFGHRKGSFTGAVDERVGLVERADGGTLFLDEIGDMPLALQAKMLRFLQEKTFMRLGATEEKKVDTRVIAATNRNLREMIEQKEFREDLFFRLNVIPLHLPPMRERREDVSLLAAHFLEIFNRQLDKEVVRIHPTALRMLENYDWPGNVRELANLMERILIFKRDDTILPEDLPPEISGITPGVRPYEARTDEGVLPLAETEKREIMRALEICGGNKTKAAEMLGITRMTVIRKLKSYGVE